MRSRSMACQSFRRLPAYTANNCSWDYRTSALTRRHEFSYVPEDNTLSRDERYAQRFWDGFRNGPKPWSDANIESLRATIRSELVRAAESTGVFPVLVGPERITEKFKEKLSACRQLARDMGYEMGPFRFNENSYVAVAEIRKVPK